MIGSDIHYRLFINNDLMHQIIGRSGNHTLRGKIIENGAENLVVVHIKQPFFSFTKFKLEVNGQEVGMRKVR